jgi:hypothetical protein
MSFGGAQARNLVRLGVWLGVWLGVLLGVLALGLPYAC